MEEKIGKKAEGEGCEHLHHLLLQQPSTGPFTRWPTLSSARPRVRDAKGPAWEATSFPNHTNTLSFDFAQEAARQFWMSERQHDADGVQTVASPPASEPAAHCPTRREAGHLRVHQELQQAIGNGPLIANAGEDMPGVNAAQIEGFKADNASINLLRRSIANGKITEAHAGYGEDGSADDHCSRGITNSLAAFLIGAGPRAYYACSRGWKVQEDPVQDAWHAEYEKPLASRGATRCTMRRTRRGGASLTPVRAARRW